MIDAFYEAVLPPEGPYCAVGILRGVVQQTFHTTIAELIARGVELSSHRYNAYFGLARYTEGVAKREAQYAQTLRCFFLDIDCGPGKPYPDLESGSLALRAFLETTGLPEPILIASGHGLHVYWALTESIPRALWIKHAKRLKEVCVAQSLWCDAAVTADSARILRMPETYNYKGDTPRAVLVLKSAPPCTLAAFLAGLPDADDLFSDPHELDALTQQLATGSTEFPSTSFARIARRSLKGSGCAQITYAIQNAETLSEPLWRAALSIAWRCEDAETAIHKLSSPYPDYDAEKTLAKAQATKGPMTCAWYKENNPAVCQGCSHNITSPISLGRVVQEGSYEVEQPIDVASDPVKLSIPAYPWPYFRGAKGGVYKRDKTKEGEAIEVEVYRQDLYLTSRFYDMNDHGEGDGELVGVCLHTEHDGVRRFSAPATSLLVQEKMRDLLLRQGVIALKDQWGLIMSYFAASIRNLQKSLAADKTRHQMGWTLDNTGFVVGEIEYTANATRMAPAAASTRLLASKLHAKGTIENWIRVLQFYNSPNMEPHKLAFLLGAGAPLLRLMNTMDVKGITVNLMSNRSGTGKTTIQHAINSIFGHPSDLLLAKKDTTLSKLQYLGMLNTIAATMDEVTNSTDEEVSDLLYDIPNGRGRHRMDSQANKLRTNLTTWNTVVVTSSNSSLYDKLARLKGTPEGEIRRLIELRLNDKLSVDKATSDIMFALLSDNYGTAGPLYVQHLMRNQAEVVQWLQASRALLDKTLNLTQADRYYSVAGALALTAGRIFKTLGLLNWDMDDVFHYLVRVIADINVGVIGPIENQDTVAQEALSAFINENITNTLVISASKVAGLVAAPLQMPRGPLRMRYEPDSYELWIPASDLRNYFTDRQVDVRAAVRLLAEKGIFKGDGTATTKRLSSGAMGNYGSTALRCYCVDAAALGLEPNTFQTPEADGVSQS